MLFKQDERRRKRFLCIGITGAVLAAAAAKASLKAEVPNVNDEIKKKVDDEVSELEDEEEEVKVKKSRKPKKSCVICVGSTGTGKSTLVKIMTGADVETSARADSVTKTSTVYSKRRGFLSRDNKKPLQYWIDTQGWEDSDIEKQDNQIFKDIFQCLYDSEMTEISGIVWNINPNERATDTLQRQARLMVKS